jgi:hypothetical protein
MIPVFRSWDKKIILFSHFITLMMIFCFVAAKITLMMLSVLKSPFDNSIFSRSISQSLLLMNCIFSYSQSACCY